MPQGDSVNGASTTNKSATDLTQLSSNQTTLLQGLCLLQATACWQLQQQSQEATDFVTLSMEQLQLVSRASKQGKLTGAAASALGLVASIALRSNAESDESAKAGTVISQWQQAAASAKEAMMQLCEAGRQVAKLPGVTAARQGVASGLAALLGAVGSVSPAKPVLDLDGASWKSEAKMVLKVSRTQQILLVAQAGLNMFYVDSNRYIPGWNKACVINAYNDTNVSWDRSTNLPQYALRIHTLWQTIVIDQLQEVALLLLLLTFVFYLHISVQQ